MTETVEQCIADLGDLKKRNRARDALRKQGAEVVPALLDRLDTAITLDHLKTIMRLLLEISDPRAEAVYRRMLDSDDEDVRAISARGLYQLGAPDALDACLGTLNDAPDMLHFDMTPSVVSLCNMGIRVLPEVLPLLKSDDARTRQRAQRVLEKVTLGHIEQQLKPPSSSPQARTAWSALWKQNGSYDFEKDETLRNASVELWRSWLNQTIKPPE